MDVALALRLNCWGGGGGEGGRGRGQWRPQDWGGGEAIGRALKKIQCQKPNLFLGDQK